MADDEYLSDYELGRRDALAEVREREADTRMGWDQYEQMQRVDPARAAEALASGNVRFDDSDQGLRIQAVLEANRAERAKMLGSTFDNEGRRNERLISQEAYEAATAEARRRDSGFGA